MGHFFTGILWLQYWSTCGKMLVSRSSATQSSEVVQVLPWLPQAQVLL